LDHPQPVLAIGGENSMKQGYSGSIVRRKGDLVQKISNDEGFISSRARQRDLIALSRRIPVLPRIEGVQGHSIYMEYVEGREELTEQNARRAGQALRLLHEQRGYQHPCQTGLQWLIHMANENLARTGSHQDFADFATGYPMDALIHSEPVQFIEQKDGSIIFIDIEGIGMGARYQDLGFVYYATIKEEKPGMFKSFLEGYRSQPIQIELLRIKKLAGVISLAYAGFAEFEKRMEFGLRLLAETGRPKR
jgi:hypothetical protein